jgi:hypothetical protein
MERDTVSSRMAHARQELTAREVALGLALVAALTFGLLLLQDPLAHDSLHNLRHTGGIVCH